MTADDRKLYEAVLLAVVVKISERATLSDLSWQEISLIAHGIAATVVLDHPKP